MIDWSIALSSAALVLGFFGARWWRERRETQTILRDRARRRAPDA